MSNVGAGRFTRYGTPGMDLDACEVTTSNGARFVLAPDLNGGLRVLLRWRGDASDADLYVDLAQWETAGHPEEGDVVRGPEVVYRDPMSL